jgi:hypothetical protein
LVHGRHLLLLLQLDAGAIGRTRLLLLLLRLLVLLLVLLLVDIVSLLVVSPASCGIG